MSAYGPLSLGSKKMSHGRDENLDVQTRSENLNARLCDAYSSSANDKFLGSYLDCGATVQ